MNMVSNICSFFSIVVIIISGSKTLNMVRTTQLLYLIAISSIKFNSHIFRV